MVIGRKPDYELIGKLRELARQGRTDVQIKAELGISYHSLVYYNGKYELRIKRGEKGRRIRIVKKPEEWIERAREIEVLIDEGAITLEQIGKGMRRIERPPKIGVTRERVRQIFEAIETLHKKGLYEKSLYDYLQKAKESRREQKANNLLGILEEALEREWSIRETEEKKEMGRRGFYNYIRNHPEYSEKLRRVYEEIVRLGEEKRRKDRQARRKLARKYSEQGVPVKEIARMIGVTVPIIYRYLKH